MVEGSLRQRFTNLRIKVAPSGEGLFPVAFGRCLEGVIGLVRIKAVVTSGALQPRNLIKISEIGHALMGTRKSNCRWL